MISLIRTSLLILLLLFNQGLYAGSVIISSDVKKQVLSRNFLLAVFSMRVTQWPDGTPIRVFVLPDRHPVHNLFVKEHLQIFPYQLRNRWDRQVYTGTGQAPIQVQDVKEMIHRVSETGGAIGYIDSPDTLSLDRVRVVDEF